jgi:hypothetical protein
MYGKGGEEKVGVHIFALCFMAVAAWVILSSATKIARNID